MRVPVCHNRFFLWCFSLGILLVLLLLSPPRVFADICYGTRVVEQYACVVIVGGEVCIGYEWTCAGNGNLSFPTEASCNCTGLYGENWGPCVRYCTGYDITPGLATCNLTSDVVNCNMASCSWGGSLKDCYWDQNNNQCVETTSSVTYGCWGPGGNTNTSTPSPSASPPPPPPTCGNGTIDPGEDCANCAADVGACPPPPPANCGNSLCDINETCSNCPGDCGACPTSPVSAVGMSVTDADTSCTAIDASTTPVSGTTFGLAPAVAPGSQTQSGATPVTWNAPVDAVSGTSYSLTISPPLGSSVVLKNACYSTTGAAPWSQGLTAQLNPAGSLTWKVGLGPPGPWVQAEAGDVYATGAIRSLVPFGTTPRVFVRDGLGGWPGIVTYGDTGVTPFDFDSSVGSNGSTIVSSTNWLVGEAYETKDFYQVFYNRFAPPATPDYLNPGAPVTQPAPRATPYTVEGDMTTSGDWSVGVGDSLVFLVNGNLTIDGRVNLTGSGFVSFIVNGNITVSPTVGTVASGTTPVLEGIYIANGAFNTGDSSVVGSERFVGNGTFVANDFQFGRDLGADNDTGAAELFVYNPQLLLTMPDAMKSVPIYWQEAAP